MYVLVRAYAALVLVYDGISQSKCIGYFDLFTSTYSGHYSDAGIQLIIDLCRDGYVNKIIG